jgi:hypothetical protein
MWSFSATCPDVDTLLRPTTSTQQLQIVHFAVIRKFVDMRIDVDHKNWRLGSMQTSQRTRQSSSTPDRLIRASALPTAPVFIRI